jgi:hypothetical protein
LVRIQLGGQVLQRQIERKGTGAGDNQGKRHYEKQRERTAWKRAVRRDDESDRDKDRADERCRLRIPARDKEDGRYSLDDAEDTCRRFRREHMAIRDETDRESCDDADDKRGEWREKEKFGEEAEHGVEYTKVVASLP